jgi:ArsR family transcriptional regulator
MTSKLNEKSAAPALAALGNETRLALFRLLVKAGDDGFIVGDIQKFLGVPLSTLSHHIRTLAQAGLIVQERRGREIISKVDYAAMNALLGFLSDECCTGVIVETASDAA